MNIKKKKKKQQKTQTKFCVAHLMSKHRVITNSDALQDVMTLSETRLIELWLYNTFKSVKRKKRKRRREKKKVKEKINTIRH